MSKGFLILTRGFEEPIVLKTINGDITIKVIGKSNSQVKVAIEAPKTVEIFREELLEEK